VPLELIVNVGRLYLGIGLGLGLGWLLSRLSSPRLVHYLGEILFWFAVPLAIAGFLYPAHLEWRLLWVVLIAWGAIALGAGVALIGLRRHQLPAQTGSLILASMVGNTGYLGYPVVLTLLGPTYFAWALIYDLLGSTTGIFGVGSVVASIYGSQEFDWRLISRRLLINPPLWGLLTGLGLRTMVLPPNLVTGLQVVGWLSVGLALLLVGASLDRPLRNLKWQWIVGVLSIKMVLVPGVVLLLMGFLRLAPGAELTLVLQAGMPPAFSSVLLAELYGLDQELSAALVVWGCLVLCLTLPLWLWGYGQLGFA
jgi:predicted permease